MKKRMPPFYFFSFILLEAIFYFIIPFYGMIRYPFNYLGIIIIGFGLWLNISSKKRVLKKKTTIIPFEKSEKLITKGAFRFTRNPMYLGMLFILVGETVILNSIALLILPLLFILLINRKFIHFEETMLENIFKDEYINYKEKVGRWL